jgi:EAL domain-containing protein (putative c-di-GMP-specific phosphodiesterase class I)
VVLARWRHPTLGPIAPSEFIVLAEHLKIIGALGNAVMRRACEFIARRGQPGQYISVNVSSLQVADTGFADTVSHILAESGATAAQLAIELTESAFGTAEAAATLHRIRDADIGLFIDDFGVGYSNLMRLQSLPFDVIKIDRGFVSEIGKDGTGVAMIRTIAVLAAELGLTVIAEGIEHEYQASALRGLGITLGQGYHYGKPEAPDKESSS